MIKERAARLLHHQIAVHLGIIYAFLKGLNFLENLKIILLNSMTCIHVSEVPGQCTFEKKKRALVRKGSGL